MPANQTKDPSPFKSYWSTPLTFVQNAGQVREAVHYLSNKPGCQIGFSSDEVLLLFTRRKPDLQEGLALSLHFRGANKDVRLEAQHPAAEKVNYFIGNDPAKWHAGLPTYQEIAYRELWPGIDLVFYGDNGVLKYDVIVKPGANPGNIRFVYQGADRLSLNGEGDLHIHTLHGVLAEKKPVSYQWINGRKVPVDTRFLLHGEQEGCEYGFEIGDGYQQEHELIIDPTLLVYSTYLGGNDTDIGYGIAVDNQDNAYVTGQTLSIDFPVTPGFSSPLKMDLPVLLLPK
ncbi:SBBP repeat-containing protein [Paenibacillus protaetiae]|uniref:DUF7948 domain-containing protein n=1 Tax=Paenibacillus protaetiae TaxID=2509456 RepID=UPI0013EB1095|nr:SBBP repeat-containing protein [Paenibacillus protaetiae]